MHVAKLFMAFLFKSASKSAFWFNIATTLCEELQASNCVYKSQGAPARGIGPPPVQLEKLFTSIASRLTLPKLNLATSITGLQDSGAPNNNIVQNHFYKHSIVKHILVFTIDIGIFLFPKIFSSVRISQLKVQ